VIKCDLCDVSCTGRDAYTAHVRGMKHQKTLKLHQKLGKPIPPDANLTQLNLSTTTIPNSSPVISAPPSVNANKLLTTNNSSVPNSKKNLISPPKVNLVGIGSNLKTITNDNGAPIDQIETKQTLNDTEGNRFETIDDGDYSNLEPIGKEYIETRLEGKILSFYCKLCECQFNDPNAKDMHTKGRRHRLAYKKKVDPSLKIDLKGGIRNSKLSSQSKQGKLLKLRGDKDKSSSKENQQLPIIQSNIGNFSNNINETNPTQMISDGNLKPLMAQTVRDDVSQSKSIQQLMEQNIR
jgi:zinc finger RNA-binding protein